MTADAFVTKFTKSLRGWLRKCGVPSTALHDTAQEALAEAVEKLREGGAHGAFDEVAARRELMRIVSNVALRSRREEQRTNARLEHVDSWELFGPRDRDEEAWIEARVMILAAFERLDEPTRALLFAREIEGRTNVEIAAALNETADAIEKRVNRAKQRLRAELERLERDTGRKHCGADLLLLGFGLDPLERAVFGTMYDAFGKTPACASLPKTHGLFRPNFPTTALVGALTLAPMSSGANNGFDRDVKHVSTTELSTNLTSTDKVDTANSADDGADDGADAASSTNHIPTTFFGLGCSSSMAGTSRPVNESTDMAEDLGGSSRPTAKQTSEPEVAEASQPAPAKQPAEPQHLKYPYDFVETPFVDDPRR